MSDEQSTIKPSTVPEANLQFKTGMECKQKGDTDAALTWFRRAVISDPSFFNAQLEIGILCRERAKLDKMYLRHAFEAYRQAARLDLTHQVAHDGYILTAQQTGHLDELISEYERWSKQQTDNALMQRCYKNIIAISMAMIPDKVEIGGGAKASGMIRKTVLFGSLLTIFAGLALIFAPPTLNKENRFTKEQIRAFFISGLVMCGFGVGGIVVYSKIK